MNSTTSLRTDGEYGCKDTISIEDLKKALLNLPKPVDPVYFFMKVGVGGVEYRRIRPDLVKPMFGTLNAPVFDSDIESDPDYLKRMCSISYGLPREYVSAGLGMLNQDNRIDPICDYNGVPLVAGDTLVHPSGEKFELVIEGGEWKADYGDGTLSRAVLQVGWKGQAVKL